ncbi:MAG TPA: ATP-binding cassette domain-containing protein [Dehalococcoidia bacterium]|nr:ATP-binding cassette domain-containing protein [Dehalococcoidia bacterium]
MLLTLRGVSKSFGGVHAVRNVDLQVEAGEIVGLIGPNGSGKTTLFNVVTGFYTPDAGTVVFDGQDITGAGPAQVCHLGIARTFQLVRPFLHLTALQNVAVARAYGREPAKSKRQAEEEAVEILDFIGFQGRSRVLARSLTLVDRKRLELGRALAARPALLLLDELLAGLNPSEVLAGLDLIRRTRDRGITVIMVEHLVQAVFAVSDRVIVMSAGEKIADGAPAAVASDQRVIDAYLGVGHHA